MGKRQRRKKLRAVNRFFWWEGLCNIIIENKHPDLFGDLCARRGVFGTHTDARIVLFNKMGPVLVVDGVTTPINGLVNM